MALCEAIDFADNALALLSCCDGGCIQASLGLRLIPNRVSLRFCGASLPVQVLSCSGDLLMSQQPFSNLTLLPVFRAATHGRGTGELHRHPYHGALSGKLDMSTPNRKWVSKLDSPLSAALLRCTTRTCSQRTLRTRRSSWLPIVVALNPQPLGWGFFLGIVDGFWVFFMVFGSLGARASQSVSQSVSQLSSQSVSHSVGQPTEQSVSQSTERLSQSVSPSVSRSVGQSVVPSRTLLKFGHLRSIVASQAQNSYETRPGKTINFINNYPQKTKIRPLLVTLTGSLQSRPRKP